MHWVIQDNMFREDGFHRLIDALDRFGLPYSVHKLIPNLLGGGLEPEPDILPGSQVMVMGSYSMAREAQRRGWKPGFIECQNLDFEELMRHPAWASRLINQDAKVYRFADVPFQEMPFFLRPTKDSKSFSGAVYDWATFREWQTHVLAGDMGGTLTADTRVMVCKKKVIWREYRIWVVKGRIVTASLYREGSRVRYSEDVEPDILLFASGVLQSPEWVGGRDGQFQFWAPADAYALDICTTPDGLFIVEANSINAAGFYAADMQKLVRALEDMR